VSYSSGLYSFFTHVISTIHKTSTMDIFGVFLVNVALGEIFLSSSSFGCDSLKVNFSESFLLGSNWFLGCWLGSGTELWHFFCAFFGFGDALASYSCKLKFEVLEFGLHRNVRFVLCLRTLKSLFKSGVLWIRISVGLLSTLDSEL
jgi:hypothetical protein